MTTGPRSDACARLDAQLPDYLAGRLDEAAAAALEAHAAGCPRCEAVLDQATAEGHPALAALATFAPPLPPTLRQDTLAAVARATPPGRGVPSASARAWRRWSGAGSALLAAAAVLLMVVRVHGADAGARARDVQGAAPTASAVLADTGPTLEDPSMPPVMQRAARLAGEPARAEFQALDAAAQELEAALADAPDDAALRDGLATVRARRAELTRQLREAAS